MTHDEAKAKAERLTAAGTPTEVVKQAHVGGGWGTRTITALRSAPHQSREERAARRTRLHLRRGCDGVKLLTANAAGPTPKL